MNYNPSNTYVHNSRAAKGFEVSVDTPAIVDGNFNMPQAEAERVFGTNGTVPEGTIVGLYPVGTTVGAYTTVAGDLKIITNGWDEFWGTTLKEVRSFGDKNNRMDYPESVGYGDRIAVATGRFNAVTQNFDVNSQNIEPGKRIYCGADGVATLDDGTVYATGSGRLYAQVMEEGFIDYDPRTGSPLVAASGGVADEIYIKTFANQG